MDRGVWHFNSAFKIGRYLYRDHKDGVKAAMLQKYSNSDVVVERGDVVIDIGANVGEFSLAAASQGAHVIAVEPDPSAYRCLELNTKNEGNVTCTQALIAERKCTKTFYISSKFSDSSVVAPTASWSEKQEVEAVDLNGLMEANGIEVVDFLKLEAEGYEPEILSGAKPVLKRIRKIAIDGSPERSGEATASACVEILKSSGFAVWQSGWNVFALQKREPSKKDSV